jgi:lipopolysaccharide/colanic/teichoic acid biosynthesis glycosyltransferase
MSGQADISPLKKLLYVGQDFGFIAQLMEDFADIFEIKIIDEALNVYKESRRGYVPDMILADYDQTSKSTVTSIQLLKAAKADEILTNIPFVFLTDQLDNEKITEAQKYKAEDIFNKNYDVQTFRTRLKYLVNKKKVTSAEVKVIKPKATFTEIGITKAKRALDITSAIALLLITSPIVLLISFIIKLTSKGPIFTRSKFVGMGHSDFFLLKFRTAEIILSKTEFEDGTDEYGFYSTKHYKITKVNKPTKNRESILNASPQNIKFTPIGRFLHKSGLENIPQLINVLRGDMSLIGIQPVSENEVFKLSELEWAKRLLKPTGITLFNLKKAAKNETNNLKNQISVKSPQAT